MSEQVRPDGVQFARGVIIAVGISMFLLGILVSAFTFTVSGWTVMAGVGVALLWACRDKDPYP